MELVWDMYICGPDRGPVYTERLFGAATKNTEKTLFLVLRFLKTTTSFVVYIFYFFFMVWPVWLCSRIPGVLAFHLLYTLINCDCLVNSVSQSVTT